MANEREQNRDITLPPDSYLYLVNEGKGGLLTVHRGPTVVNQTGSDQPVKYDVATRTYKPCSLEQAVQTCPRANEGDYVVLENPAENSQRFPSENTQQAIPLCKGRKVIIPGPWSEALWPGQTVTTIEGHRLRTNQYVVAIVYNADEAQKNWETGTVAVSQTDTELNKDEKKAEKSHVKGLPKPDSFAVGTRIIIMGSDVSFFIPCTGVEILRDVDGKYIREAVTLEQLEYCCLVDESGKKDYPRGPKVVFPKPTQIFETDKRGRRKFRPIELNTINGIHVKVTADFSDEDITTAELDEKGKRATRQYREGEELFITGKTLSIYYPREELAILEYGQGNKKHFSTAIPKGEGRYVINRETGEIRLECGPRMFLADPRFEIPVRRVLSTDECELWYPGNGEALEYNAELGAVMADSPSGRSGVVSEGDYRKSQQKRSLESMPMTAAAFAGPSEYDPDMEETGEAGGLSGSITRSTRFTAPRLLTLNTKFDGVPRIEVWPGFAVLIVGAEGSRRVEQGPKVVLLEYDEKLGHMSLSTGKPKSTDKLHRTSYLCTQNNQVSDIVPFESSDHVKGTIKLSLRVNFEAKNENDKLLWFSVDNYVKYLTDHVRSIIGGMGKRNSVAEIKADYVNLVRDSILGNKPTVDDRSEPLNTSRPGLTFPDNGMRVVEVEVLEISLSDKNIALMLDQGQLAVVQTNIEIENARRNLVATREKNKIAQAIEIDILQRNLETTEAREASSQKTLKLQEETFHLKRQLEQDLIIERIESAAKELELELKRIGSKKEITEAQEEIADYAHRKNLERSRLQTEQLLLDDKSRLELKKDELESATEAAVKRFVAAKDGLSEVMLSLGRDDMAIKFAEACNIERFIGGDGLGNSVSNLMAFMPSLKAFFDKATEGQTNGRNRLKTSEVLPNS